MLCWLHVRPRGKPELAVSRCELWNVTHTREWSATYSFVTHGIGPKTRHRAATVPQCQFCTHATLGSWHHQNTTPAGHQSPAASVRSLLGLLCDLLGDHVSRLLDCGDLLCALLLEFQVELVLEGHHDLHLHGMTQTQQQRGCPVCTTFSSTWSSPRLMREPEGGSMSK